MSVDLATPHEDSFETFVQHALILGCSGEEASLWARIALQRTWDPGRDLPEFDAAVLDYLVDLGQGRTWVQDLRVVLSTVPSVD